MIKLYTGRLSSIRLEAGSPSKQLSPLSWLVFSPLAMYNFVLTPGSSHITPVGYLQLGKRSTHLPSLSQGVLLLLQCFPEVPNKLQCYLWPSYFVQPAAQSFTGHPSLQSHLSVFQPAEALPSVDMQFVLTLGSLSLVEQ